MEHPGFFQKAGPFSLSEVCSELELDMSAAKKQSLDQPLDDVKGIGSAGPSHITYFEDRKWLKDFECSKAGLCFTTERYAKQAPETMIAVVADKPQTAFVKAIELFYPNSHHTLTSLSTQTLIDPSAKIAEDVVIEAGTVIGKEVVIGKGSRITAGSVIGYRTYIGENCVIGPNVTLTHSLVGNNVIIHPGVSIGQDGFGYMMGPEGHKKIPQIGRVIIQDGVEIGANTTIDRGALADTIIGEGTKIDNLVQIGHNVVIGCHSIIVAQTGLSGSTKLGNFVVMGGQTGTVGHITIGDGAQIAASSDVNGDVPAGARYGGTPAKPVKLWFKEIIALERLVEERSQRLKQGIKKADT